MNELIEKTNELLLTMQNQMEEENKCICGEELESCPDAYVHMTSGV